MNTKHQPQFVQFLSGKSTYLVFTLFLLHSTLSFAQPASFGINVSTFTPNTTEFTYKDIAKLMQAERNGVGFLEAQFDTNGYAKYLNAGQTIKLGFGSGTGQIWPTGDYHIFFDGEGTLVGRTDNETLKQNLGNGHQIWTISHGNYEWFGFEITTTNSSNYLKNLRIIMPGFEDNYAAEPLHPTYIENWSMFSTFRFMDWMGINASPIVNYSQVKPAGYISQSGYNEAGVVFSSDASGGSLDLAIDLCNQMNKDMWISLPHKASDECVTKIAQRVKMRLKPALKVYLEYSNEVWNWAFPQASYSRDQGEALGLTTDGALEYYVYRSGEIYKLWEDVYGTGKDRVINVFAWQTTSINPEYWINLAINTWFNSSQYNPAGVKPEFYANAPYIWDQSATDPTSVDELFDGAFGEDLQRDKDIMSSQKAYATANGLEYGTYEAGQHYSSYAQNEPLDLAVLIPANRDERMKTLYLEYLNYWKDNVGGLMMLYSSCGPNSKYGSWGLIESYNQPVATRYKYEAVKEVIQGVGGGGGDTEAPTSPTDLIITNIDDKSFSLSWMAATDNVGVTKYYVYKDQSFAGSTTTTSINIKGLKCDTDYDITVKAKDADGNSSAASLISNITTSGCLGGPTLIYQGENAALTGGADVWSDHSGYLGAGFAGLPGEGATVTFTVNTTIAGSRPVEIRYAGPGSTIATSLYFNGQKVKQISFPTSGWDTWLNVNESLSFDVGNNTIALKWDAGDTGGPNIDYISVGSVSSEPMGDISATGITINGAANVNINQSAVYSIAYSPLSANQFGVEWSSSNPAIASVNNGTVSGLSLGNVTITALYVLNNEIMATKAITVVVPVSAVSVTGQASLMVGQTTTLLGIVQPLDASNATLNWQSSNSTFATVNSSGVVSALMVGTVTITATSLDGPSGQIVLIISPIPAISISIFGNAFVYKGASSQLSASILPSTATNKAVTWKSSNISIASISGSGGLLKALNVGMVSITATSVGTPTISTIYEIHILPISVTSVGINGSKILAVGSVTTLTTTVLPANATDKSLLWTSSDESVASVTSATGIVTALNNGIVTISASSLNSLGVSGSFLLTVTGSTKTTTFESATSEISIYPNPTLGLFFISVNGVANVDIFDLQGKLIESSVITGTTPFNSNLYSKGIYIVRVTKEAEVIMKKLIRE